MKNILAATAAAGLVFTPVAAQAGTRAADTAISMEALSFDRAASPVGLSEAQSDEDGGSNLLLLLAFAALAAGIVLVVEGGENDTSPGNGG